MNQRTILNCTFYLLIVVNMGGCLSQNFEQQSLRKYKTRHASTFVDFQPRLESEPIVNSRPASQKRQSTFPRGRFSSPNFSSPNFSSPRGGMTSPRGGFSWPRGRFSQPTGGGFSWPNAPPQNENGGRFTWPKAGTNGFSQPDNRFTWPRR